jgi:hypothetical protein
MEHQFMNIRNLVLAAAAVVFVSTGADAQSVEGKWTVEYPTRVASTNGESHVEAVGTGTLVIDRISGDSLFGKWITNNVQDPAKQNPPRRIVGAMTGTTIQFVGEPVEARMRRSMNGGGEGDESVITMRTYFNGIVTGSSIEGMMYSQTDDETIKSSPVKWSAKKAE